MGFRNEQAKNKNNPHLLVDGFKKFSGYLLVNPIGILLLVFKEIEMAVVLPHNLR